jgi:hypothetical protein
MDGKMEQPLWVIAVICDLPGHFLECISWCPFSVLPFECHHFLCTYNFFSCFFHMLFVVYSPACSKKLVRGYLLTSFFINNGGQNSLVV